MNEIDAEKTVRIFFALWPDEAERTALAVWQPVLHKLCGGRVTPAARLHNTLVFLGEVQAGRLEALQLAAGEVNGAAFRLVFDVARYWGHNHIAYAAPCSVPQALLALVNDLVQSLRRHHFQFDHRAYKPHVTLLRHAHWTDSPMPVMQRVEWRVRDFALVQSVSGAQGVHYEVLARFDLKY